MLRDILNREINVCLIPVFYFAVFWTFFLNFGLSQNLLLSAFLCCLLVFVLIRILEYESYLHLIFKIQDLLIVFILLSIYWVINQNFRFSVSGDHLSHLLATYQIPIGLLKLFGIDFIKDYLDISANRFLQLYSVLNLILFFFFYLLYLKKKKLFFLFFVIFSLFGLVTKFFFNPYITHPELRTLTLLFLGSFGIENNIFRLQGIVAISILFLYLRQISIRNEYLYLFLLFSSCPLLFFTAPLIEFSIWALVCNSIFLIEILRSKNNINLRKVLLISIMLCLGSLIRQPIAFSFLPLILYLVLIKKYKMIGAVSIFFLVSFCQVLVPIIYGNPALGEDNTPFLGLNPESLSPINKVVYSFSFLSIQNKFLNLGVIYSLFICLSILIFKLKEKFFLLSFFLLSWMIYHFISIELWGNPRYISEYLIPLAFLVAYHLITYYNNHRKLIFVSTTIIVIVNAFLISNQFKELRILTPFEYDREIVVQRMESRFKSERILVSEEVYDWNIAVKKIPAECYGKSKMNINFGVFPLAFNKEVSIKDFIASHLVTGGHLQDDFTELCEYKWSVGEEGLAYNKTWNTNLILVRK